MSVDKQQYKDGLDKMGVQLDLFKMFKEEAQQEAELVIKQTQDEGRTPSTEEAGSILMANMASVVFDMASRYYGLVIGNYGAVFKEDYDGQWAGLGRVDRKSTGGEGTTGTSVQETGVEPSADTRGSGDEASGTGGVGRDGDEHAGGDRDGSDEDTRQ